MLLEVTYKCSSVCTGCQKQTLISPFNNLSAESNRSCGMQPSAVLGRSDIRNYFLWNQNTRSTHVLVSAPNILQYSLDSLTQEQHLPRGNEVALVLRQPFCFCWQKITRFQFQEFVPFCWPQNHLPHLPSNYSAGPHFLALNLLSFTGCIFPTKPWFLGISMQDTQIILFISTASHPPLPPHSASEDSHDCLHVSSNIDLLPLRELFSIHHFAKPCVYSL